MVNIMMTSFGDSRKKVITIISTTKFIPPPRLHNGEELIETGARFLVLTLMISCGNWFLDLVLKLRKMMSSSLLTTGKCLIVYYHLYS